MLFDWASHALFPSAGADSLPEPTAENREIYLEAIKKMIAELPVGALLTVMFGWWTAGFVGGATAGKITPAFWKTNALTVGFILFAATLANLLMLPHPLWMTIAGLSGIVPLSYLGGKLFR